MSEKMLSKVSTGVQAIFICVVALFIGSRIEKYFSRFGDYSALIQLFLTVVCYAMFREYFPNLRSNAFLGYASMSFVSQPTLIPKMRRIFNI